MSARGSLGRILGASPWDAGGWWAWTYRATASSSSSRRRARACSCSAALVASRPPTRCCAGSSPTPRACPPTTSSSSTRAACAGHGTGASGSPYPLTASGASWYADVAVSGDAIVAAAATRHPLGVGMEAATLESGAVIDEAAFHASERAALDELDASRGGARARDAVGAQDRAPPRDRPHRLHRAVAARPVDPGRRRRHRPDRAQRARVRLRSGGRCASTTCRCPATARRPSARASR